MRSRIRFVWTLVAREEALYSCLVWIICQLPFSRTQSHVARTSSTYEFQKLLNSCQTIELIMLLVPVADGSKEGSKEVASCGLAEASCAFLRTQD